MWWKFLLPDMYDILMWLLNIPTYSVSVTYTSVPITGKTDEEQSVVGLYSHDENDRAVNIHIRSRRTPIQIAGVSLRVTSANESSAPSVNFQIQGHSPCIIPKGEEGTLQCLMTLPIIESIATMVKTRSANREISYEDVSTDLTFRLTMVDGTFKDIRVPPQFERWVYFISL